MNHRESAKVANKYNISKELLEDIYLRKRLSCLKIGNIFNVSRSTIRLKLKEYNIHVRTISEAMIIHPKTSFSNNEIEKAYMLGLRAGDLYATKHYNHIRVTTTTTHKLFVEMIENTFGKYAKVSKHLRFNKDHDEWIVYCDLDKSFSFMLEKPNEIPLDILKNDNKFILFLQAILMLKGTG